jgi:hypothetical protein
MHAISGCTDIIIFPYCNNLVQQNINTALMAHVTVKVLHHKALASQKSLYYIYTLFWFLLQYPFLNNLSLEDMNNSEKFNLTIW